MILFIEKGDGTSAQGLLQVRDDNEAHQKVHSPSSGRYFGLKVRYTYYIADLEWGHYSFKQGPSTSSI